MCWLIHSEGWWKGNFCSGFLLFMYYVYMHLLLEFSLTLTLPLDRLNSSFISTHLFKVLNLLKAKENIDVKQEDSMMFPSNSCHCD